MKVAFAAEIKKKVEKENNFYMIRLALYYCAFYCKVDILLLLYLTLKQLHRLSGKHKKISVYQSAQCLNNDIDPIFLF